MHKKPPDDSKLLVISFDDPLRAQEFLLATARLQKNGEIQVHDAVVIQREADGTSRVRETTDVTPGQAGVGAGVWGLWARRIPPCWRSAPWTLRWALPTTLDRPISKSPAV